MNSSLNFLPRWRSQGLTVLLVLTAVAFTTGCGIRRVAHPAPVEDRAIGRVDVRALPGAENAGKPGYYTVRAGDTLTRIALDSGQSWRDLQAWNNLGNPNLLEVGQVLRIVPPLAATATATATETAPTAAVVAAGAATPAALTSPDLVSRPLAPADTAAAAPAASDTATATPGAPTVVAAAAESGASSEIGLVWPAQGEIISTFDEARNKGIAIAGRIGDPVLAAADGRVVYAGAGLRGYGNLIILKHNNTFLTAYAHNQELLVREDQVVRQGQRIAAMGSSDADRVKLHFEVRRLGRPVDPLNHLPRR